MGRVYDLTIIGGGPAGLSTAVGASSEKIDTLLLDGLTELGGQARTSSLIENYAGFPCGVTGRDLTDRMQQQAHRFGTDMIAPVTVSKIYREKGDGILTVKADTGECFSTRAIALAIGVQYRRLPIMNVVHYLNRGVAYGSPSLDITYTNKQLVVVGGANSAGQAAVHLAKCPDSTVHVIVRGSALDLKMSHYLVDRIEQTPNIIVHLNTQVTSVNGNGKLESITLTSPEVEVEMPTDYMFVMIGAVPKTTWLEGCVEMVRGYILAGRDLSTNARVAFEGGCKRLPYDSETSMHGVFVVGDVRANAVRRVGAAVGAGAHVIPDIHQHLATQ